MKNPARQRSSTGRVGALLLAALSAAGAAGCTPEQPPSVAVPLGDDFNPAVQAATLDGRALGEDPLRLPAGVEDGDPVEFAATCAVPPGAEEMRVFVQFETAGNDGTDGLPVQPDGIAGSSASEKFPIPKGAATVPVRVPVKVPRTAVQYALRVEVSGHGPTSATPGRRPDLKRGGTRVGLVRVEPAAGVEG